MAVMIMQPQPRQVTAPNQPDSYEVYMEVERPLKRGKQVNQILVHLPVEVLEQIWSAAARVTDGIDGEFFRVTVRIDAPNAKQIIDAARRPAAPVQPSLFEVKDDAEGDEEPVEDEDEDDVPPHNCQPDSDGLCIYCGEPVEDDDEEDAPDPIGFLVDQLASAADPELPPQKREEMAFEVWDRALQAGLEDDDLDGIWAWYQTYVRPLYKRFQQGQHANKLSIGQRLDVIEQIYELACQAGVDVDTPFKVWEWYAMSGDLRMERDSWGEWQPVVKASELLVPAARGSNGKRHRR